MAKADWSLWSALHVDVDGIPTLNSTLASNPGDEEVVGVWGRRVFQPYGVPNGTRAWRALNTKAEFGALPISQSFKLRATMRAEQKGGGSPVCALIVRADDNSVLSTALLDGYTLRLQHTGAATLSLVLAAKKGGSATLTLSTTTGLSKSRWYDVELGVRADDATADYLSARYRLTKAPDAEENAWTEVGEFAVGSAAIQYLPWPKGNLGVELQAGGFGEQDYAIIADFKIF